MMKTFSAFLFFFLLINTSEAQKKADLIIINGKITTLDDNNAEVQAVAVAGNKIIVTGTNEEVLKLKGKQTKVVDDKGSRVIPGLFDSHMQVIRGGRFYK